MTRSHRAGRPAPTCEAAPPPPADRPFDIRSSNGMTALHYQGKPIPAVFTDLRPGTPTDVMEITAAAGGHLYRICEVDLGWKGIGQFDYTPLLARLKALLVADPQAHCLLVVTVDAPQWWLAAHPEEGVVYCDQEGTTPAVSWASRRWMTETGNALTRMVRYLAESEEGRRCIGYQLAAGVQGEWRLPFPENLPDIGPKMTEAFRSYAKEKYRHNPGLLKKAWGDTRPDFDIITCPNAWERSKGDFGIFRSPAKTRRVADYHECFADAQNKAAIHFCTSVKRASQGKALVGITYATALNATALPEDGHAYPEPVLDAAEIDFFTVPTSAGDTLTLRSLPGSLRLRDKLVLLTAAGSAEADLLTAMSAALQCGVCLPSGTSADPLKFALKLASEILKAPAKLHKRSSQVAVVIDMAASCHLAAGKSAPSIMFNALLIDLFRELNRLGTPYDVYQLGDLFHPKFLDHKVTIFPNMFCLTEAERRRVDGRVKRSEQTAIWLYAPGLLGEEGADAANVKSLTGMKARLETEESSLKVRISVSDDPLTWGYHAGSSFGTDKPLSPTVTLADKQLTRLGANSNNKTSFAIFRFPQWNSVVFGSFPVPRTLLRNTLRAAGVHLYLDTAEAEIAVLADARTLALYARKPGTYTLSLPGLHDVKSVQTGKTVAHAATELPVTLTTAGTAYFELTPLKPRKPPRLAEQKASPDPEDEDY